MAIKSLIIELVSSSSILPDSFKIILSIFNKFESDETINSIAYSSLCIFIPISS